MNPEILGVVLGKHSLFDIEMTNQGKEVVTLLIIWCITSFKLNIHILDSTDSTDRVRKIKQRSVIKEKRGDILDLLLRNIYILMTKFF